MKPGIYQRGEVDYWSIDAVNQSSLKRIGKSPLHYQHGLISGVKVTEPMRLGSVAHCALLEPHLLAANFAVWRGGPGLKTDNFTGTLFEAFKLENAHREIIKQRDLDAGLAMARHIRAHKRLAQYLARGMAELTLVWVDPETGLLCKARLDWVSLSVENVMLEVKTTTDVGKRALGKRFAEMEYDVQTAFYCDGWKVLTGKELYPKCGAVESAPPHDVVSYDLAEIVDAGREIYRGYMQKLVECRKSGEWPGQSPDEEECLTLPAWRDPFNDDNEPLNIGIDWGAAHG